MITNLLYRKRLDLDHCARPRLARRRSNRNDNVNKESILLAGSYFALNPFPEQPLIHDLLWHPLTVEMR
jgi:hypothetical protein